MAKPQPSSAAEAKRQNSSDRELSMAHATSGPNGQLDECALQAHVEYLPKVVRLDHRPARHRGQRRRRASQLITRLRVAPYDMVRLVRKRTLAIRNVGVDEHAPAARPDQGQELGGA